MLIFTSGDGNTLWYTLGQTDRHISVRYAQYFAHSKNAFLPEKVPEISPHVSTSDDRFLQKDITNSQVYVASYRMRLIRPKKVNYDLVILAKRYINN